MAVSSITSAFSVASQRLGFAFEPAFVLTLPSGKVITTLGLVHGFGSKAGTLLFFESSAPSQEEQAEIKAMGYYFSVLFPSYSTYDEALFKDALDDWQYFGRESNRPSWFTGQSWGAKA
jgi:hypothetical protein